jgi:hypothetical protein
MRSTFELHTGQACRHFELARICRALLVDHAHDLGNDITCAANGPTVSPILTSLGQDLIEVVQRSACHGDAAYEHGSELCHRCQRARASDLHLDRFDPTHRLFRREFVVQWRSARTRDITEPLLSGERVHLVRRRRRCRKGASRASADRFVVLEQTVEPDTTRRSSATRKRPSAR